ncbi:hypothetical protein V6N11_042851 [Hibiscus sabdariffa]|uniref:Uncharacterized protein n=1 Tax=Hibiscus sabdariffa TaxID=183260 RepID=A0ABR2QXJ4_9ROSI
MIFFILGKEGFVVIVGSAILLRLGRIVAMALLAWNVKNHDVKLSVLQYDKHFINIVISINGEAEWFGTFIYAPPYENEKQEFWERLSTLRNDLNAKWYIMGDTNIVASPNEKYGGSSFDHNNAK